VFFSVDLANSEEFAAKAVEASAAQAELRGLAEAIGDDELRRLANEVGAAVEDFPDLSGADAMAAVTLTLQNRYQSMHTRIAQLLKEATSTL